MSHLPPPPPPETIRAPTLPAPRGRRKGVMALIAGVAVLLLFAAGAAIVIFVPSVAALVGITGQGQSAAAPAATGAASEAASPGAAASASPTGTPSPTATFEMAPLITSPPPAVAPSAPAATARAESSRSPLDLGLAIPVDIVPCDGQYRTFYFSSIDPASYAKEIQSYLNAYPGSRYLVTEGSCNALNQVSKNNTRIYAVYSGPYATAASACQAKAGQGGAYVKVMTQSSSSESTVACS